MQLPLIKQISLAVVLAGSSSFLFAQDTTTHVTLVQTVKPLDGGSGFRRWSLGINGGVLAPVVGTGGYNDFTKWQPTLGYGAYVKYQVTHMLGLQLDYVGGSLKGNNDNKEGDGTSATSPYSAFKTDMTGAGSLSIVYSFSNINWMHRRNIIIPYFSIGAGAAKFKNPVLTLDDGTTKPYTTPKGINQFFVPVGAGLKINVATGVNIDLGYRMFFVDGDNIDGYKVYLGHMDHFSYGFAGLEFSLGRKSKQQLIVDNPVYDLHEAVTRENEALRARLEAENEAARKEDQAKLAEVAALRDQIGKLTADADGDGVSDYFDKCPGTPAGTKVDGSGCALPQPPQVEEKVIITEDDRRLVRDAIQNLEFDLGKASLAPSSYSSLDKVAGILVSKHFSLKLAGHTDNVGSQDNNMRLSKDRAESVKAYLVSKGANPSRIEATGYGMTQPIASNKTAEGRQKNRRVEFTLY